jgi:hypothetical protein
LDDTAGKIETTINNLFDSGADSRKNNLRTVFSRGVTYIVEASPNRYTDWKVIGDGRTIYISLAATNAADMALFYSGIIALRDNFSYAN